MAIEFQFPHELEVQIDQFTASLAIRDIEIITFKTDDMERPMIVVNLKNGSKIISDDYHLITCLTAYESSQHYQQKQERA